MVDSRTPYIAEMDRILSAKRSKGLRGVRLFVRDGGDVTSEDVARGYCQMCKAEDDRRFADVSDEVL